MSIELIIVIAVAIVALIIVIKFLKKIVKVLASIVIVVAAFLGIYIYTDIFEKVGIVENDFEFTLASFENKYCSEMKSPQDSVKCFLIVQPISNEIKSKLNVNELESIKNDKKAVIVVVKNAIEAKKAEIQEKLKDKNSLYLWNDFIKDLIQGKIFTK